MKTIDLKKKNRFGFTLMEMLIVVAIIAILVAITIPVLNKSLEKARRAADAATARNLYAVLKAAYIDGSIDFNGNLTYEGNQTCIGVVVHKDKDPDYRASGYILVNGGDWNADKGKENYARVKELFENAGISNLKISSRSSSDDGWECYCIVLFSDGTCRIISSTSDIDIGNTNGGVFETTFKNLADKYPSGSTALEKYMGNIE